MKVVHSEPLLCEKWCGLLMQQKVWHQFLYTSVARDATLVLHS